jgi:hypothetical protein
MSKKNYGLLSSYLESKDENEANNKLNKFAALMGDMKNNPIGQLVHTLVLNKLMRKAQEENTRNKANRHKIFEDYNDRQFNEAVYLKKMEQEGKLEKEARKHAQELAKEIRNHKYEEESFKNRKAVEDAYNQQSQSRKTTAKAFLDPMEAVRYLNDKTGSTKDIEAIDTSGLWHKTKGHFKEFVGGEKYQPKKTNLRYKK